MYSQVIGIGERDILLNESIDHRCNTSKVIPIQDSFTKTNTRQLFKKHTTEGWDILDSE